jgi:cyanophycinase
MRFVFRCSLLSAIILFFSLLPASLAAQGYVMLAGGGSESSSSSGWSAEPYGWFVDQADVEGRNGIIILSNSDTSDWLPNYFLSLGADEVTNMTITQHTPSQIEAAVSGAAGVFFKGGNQQNYLDAWRGTGVQTAVQQLFEAGGAIGGTSAGAMIAGQFVSSNTESRGSTSDDNLRDPFNAFNNIETDFLGLLPATVVDTHYFERGRPGRLLGMIGRIHAEFSASELTGIGIDDKTAVMIFPDNRLRVSGTGGVHIFRLGGEDSDTEIDARSGRPLLIRNLPMHQLTHGFELDLTSGELLTTPDDAFTVPQMPEVTLAARINLERGQWDVNYLNSPELINDTLRIVLDAGYSDTEAIGDHPAEAQFITPEPENFNDAEWIESLFAGDRVFMNIPPQQWKELSASNAFQQYMGQHEDAAIELLSTHLPVSGAGYATNLSEGEFISYDGLIQHREGSGLLPHVVSVDSTYAEREFYENRASAPGWLLHQYEAYIGINGTRLSSLSYDGASGALQFDNQLMPALVMDARSGYTTASSPFVASGSSNQTRNAAAVSHALMHVLPRGETFQLYADGTPVSIPDEAQPQQPGMFRIESAYPNPFNPSTTFQIQATEALTAGIAVFNMLGQKVYSRPEYPLRSGRNQISISLGGQSSGVYLMRITAGGTAETKRVTLVK